LIKKTAGEEMNKYEKIVEEFFLLLSYMRMNYFRPAEQITRSKLSPGQFHTISILRKGPLPMKELAGRMMISKQQLTPLVSKLIDAGLVKRKTDENDRRVVLIEVTERGVQLHDELKTDIKRAFIKKISVLPEDQIDELEIALKKIQTILKGAT
jgi:DNA-binding MarR family transcriptional regulator